MIQAYTRRWLMRRRHQLELDRQRQLQHSTNAWEAASEKAASEAAALVQIQSAARGHMQRERLRSEREERALLVEAEQTSQIAERARLVKECTAVIEKRSRRCISIGPWELVVWRERVRPA